MRLPSRLGAAARRPLTGSRRAADRRAFDL